LSKVRGMWDELRRLYTRVCLIAFRSLDGEKPGAWPRGIRNMGIDDLLMVGLFLCIGIAIAVFWLFGKHDDSW